MTLRPDMDGWSDREVIRYGIRHDLSAMGCTCIPIVAFGDSADGDGKRLPFAVYVTHTADCPMAVTA